MKAVLVLNRKPKDCNKCPLFYLDNDMYYGYYACVQKEVIYQDVGHSKKPKHCPLKPLPQEKKTDIVSFTGLCEQYRKVGWNECLDEILGGKK